MSSQKEGILDTNQSFNYKRDTLENYNAQGIDASKFTSWQKDNFYKSSYAHFHSKVFYLITQDSI